MARNSENTPEPVAEEGRSETYLNTVRVILALHRHLRRYSKELQAGSISGRQYATLRYLDGTPSCTMGQLAAYLFVNESTTTELVGKLELEGLAQRLRSPRDNRVVEVSITAKGRQTVRSTPLGGVPLLRERLKALGDEELRDIEKSVRRLLELLNVEHE